MTKILFRKRNFPNTERVNVYDKDGNNIRKKPHSLWLWYIICLAVPAPVISMHFILNLSLEFLILIAMGACFAMSFAMLGLFYRNLSIAIDNVVARAKGGTVETE